MLLEMCNVFVGCPFLTQKTMCCSGHNTFNHHSKALATMSNHAGMCGCAKAQCCGSANAGVGSCPFMSGVGGRTHGTHCCGPSTSVKCLLASGMMIM